MPNFLIQKDIISDIFCLFYSILHMDFFLSFRSLGGYELPPLWVPYVAGRLQQPKQCFADLSRKIFSVKKSEECQNYAK